MNALQTFIARCTTQARPVIQEQFEANSSVFYGTFDAPQPNVDMLRHGYEEWATNTIAAAADQFAVKLLPRQIVKRLQTGKNYFIQKLDTDDPVIWKIDLVDRQPNAAG